jgi:hypothetical protein
MGRLIDLNNEKSGYKNSTRNKFGLLTFKEIKDYIEKDLGLRLNIDKNDPTMKKITTHTVFPVVCNKCNNVRRPSLMDLDKQNWCKKCNKPNDKYREALERFTQSINDEGFILISDIVGTNVSDKVSLICPIGHNIEVTRNNWMGSGSRCRYCANNVKKTWSIERLREHETRLNITILNLDEFNDDTLNGTSTIRYRCGYMGCNNTSQTNCKNLEVKKVGCNSCGRFEHKNKKFSEICDLLRELGSNIRSDIDHYKKYFTIKFLCARCKQKILEKKWKPISNRRIYCDECTKKNRCETNIQRYNDPQFFASLDFKQKQKEYYRTHYGVEYNMQVPEIAKKARQTNINTHGGLHNLATEFIRRLMREGFYKKYGCTQGNHLESREKMKETNLEKYGTEFIIGSKYFEETMIDKYGTIYYALSEDGKQYMMTNYGSKYYVNSQTFRKKMLELYGVEHAMQNPFILEKAFKSAHKRKEYILPDGTITSYQGYENFMLDYMYSIFEQDDVVNRLGEVPRIPYVYGNTNRYYFPDAYVKSLNLIIEVKSLYTLGTKANPKELDKNREKFRAVIDQGYNFLLVVYDSKGNLVLSNHKLCQNNCCIDTNEEGFVDEINNTFKCDKCFKNTCNYCNITWLGYENEDNDYPNYRCKRCNMVLCEYCIYNEDEDGDNLCMRCDSEVVMF